MDHLGNVYFYFVLLLIIIILIAILIANSIYFTDIYNSNCQNTSSQQILLLNIFNTILLLFTIFFVIYMINIKLWIVDEPGSFCQVNYPFKYFKSNIL